MTDSSLELEAAVQNATGDRALVPIHRQLSPRVRTLCGALGVVLTGAGGTAVFVTMNELGSAALLVMGALFVVIALLGYIPRMKWGGAEVDPALLYAAGVAHGAEEVSEAAQGLLATSPADEDVSEALDAVAAEVASRELRRAVSRTVPKAGDDAGEAATLEQQARDLGISRERARQLRQRASDLGLSSLPLDVVLNLGRFAAYNRGEDHHAVARELSELGFAAYAPQSRAAVSDSAAYIRWLYPGVSGATVRLYQNSAGLVSDSRPQYEFAKGLAGADPEGGVHPKVRFYYANSSVPTVLAAARAFRDRADGQ